MQIHNKTLGIIVIIAIIVATYWIVRYGGYTSDGDTNRMINFISHVTTAKTINIGEEAYPSGFGFIALQTFLVRLTGLQVSSVLSGSTYWLIVFILMLYLSASQILKHDNNLTPMLCVIFLFALPDVLFYLLRGSHERFTWFFAMLLLFLLNRSTDHVSNTTEFAKYVFLFYLIFFAMTTFHVFFASTLFVSFVFALLIYGLGSVARGLLGTGSNNLLLLYSNRILLIVFSLSIIIFLVVNFLYEPASVYYQGLTYLVDRIALLGLGGEPAGSENVYAFVSRSWRGSNSYIFLTFAQWIILFMSALGWLYYVVKTIRTQIIDFSIITLLIFYFALAFLVVLGVVIDLLNLLYFNNLQVRLFVFFGILSTILSSGFIVEVFLFLKNNSRKMLANSLFVFCFLISSFGIVTSLLKTTSDPVFSLNWIFFSPSEQYLIEWIEDEHIENSLIRWGSLSDRRSAVDIILPFDRESTNRYLITDVEDFQVEYIIQSDISISNDLLAGTNPPPTIYYDRIYSNGKAKLYRRIPQTQFQQ